MKIQSAQTAQAHAPQSVTLDVKGEFEHRVSPTKDNTEQNLEVESGSSH